MTGVVRRAAASLPAVLRVLFLLGVIGLVLPAQGFAAPAKIKKVLWFHLDKEGRQSLSPSLFDRDAYQAELRAAPAKRSGLRIDVQWEAQSGAELELREEMYVATRTTSHASRILWRLQ